jgi:hypothetical protein
LVLMSRWTRATVLCLMIANGAAFVADPLTLLAGL